MDQVSATEFEVGNGVEALSLESGQAPEEREKKEEYVITSAHAVDKGLSSTSDRCTHTHTHTHPMHVSFLSFHSWQQVGLMLVTGFNCAYVLSFSNLMLVPLGWAWGLTCLAVVGAFAYYANWFLAGLHVIDGHRFIRYRDLMGFICDHVFSFHCDQVFTRSPLKPSAQAINSEFSNSPLRLQVFISATGVVYFIFAYFVPTMSAMRNWLATSAVLTVIYDVVLAAILVKDEAQLDEGKANKTKDYNVQGSEVQKVFNAFGAIAAILVCNTSGLLPEIQVRKKTDWVLLESLLGYAP
ncbi:hypothetical protein BHE74_00002268 [Ensete ventricosum]|nr:hypothetical protein BHE74_00002268 [Ensete ventricosum]